MKVILVAAFLLLLIAGPAYSADQSIHVEWGYTPPSDPAVTGYRLYQVIGGVPTPVHSWAGADVRDGDCTVDITDEVTTFTLTATFADATESPHSAPFEFIPGVTPIVRFVWLGRPGSRHVPMTKPQGARLR